MTRSRSRYEGKAGQADSAADCGLPASFIHTGALAGMVVDEHTRACEQRASTSRPSRPSGIAPAHPRRSASGIRGDSQSRPAVRRPVDDAIRSVAVVCAPPSIPILLCLLWVAWVAWVAIRSGIRSIAQSRLTLPTLLVAGRPGPLAHHNLEQQPRSCPDDAWPPRPRVQCPGAHRLSRLTFL